MAAWDMAAREVLGERRAQRRRGNKVSVPARFMPISVWGHGKQEGARIWKALKEVQNIRAGEGRQPDLRQGGRKLKPGQVIEKAEEKWNKLYGHPREGPGWDEHEWAKNCKK